MNIELPQDLKALTDEQLAQLTKAATDAIREANITADSSDDDLAEAERILSVVEGLQAESVARAEAKTARSSRVTDLLSRMPKAPEAPEAPAAPAAPVAEAAPPAPEAPAADAVAAAGLSPAARAARNAPAPIVPRAARPVIVASVDVPEFSAGAKLEGFSDVGRAIVSRLNALPRGAQPAPVRQRFGAARIHRDFPTFSQAAFQNDDLALLTAVTDERQLAGGSLTAAGGWCSPSETVYDMCQLETATGLLDLPTFGVNRGGIRYTPGPSFDDIYTAAGFVQTEQDAIDGDCKTCHTVTCPSFTDVRLNAIGYCLKVPILTNDSYPELVQRFVEGTVVAHAHKVNAWLIAKMGTAAGTAVTVGTNPGSASYGLDALELQALGLRYQYRLDPMATIEIIAPLWYKTLIRMDVARRSNVDWNSVTDEQIDANLAIRNIRAQWVYDYQDLAVSAGNVVTLPSSVTVLMYPAGTWARGGGPIISIDAVYDSVGLESNTFTGTFVEESILAVQRCSRTVKLTIPVTVTGATAQAAITAALAAAA